MRAVVTFLIHVRIIRAEDGRMIVARIIVVKTNGYCYTADQIEYSTINYRLQWNTQDKKEVESFQT